MYIWYVDEMNHLSPPHLLSSLLVLGFGRKEVVECLIERGATVDIQDDGESDGEGVGWGCVRERRRGEDQLCLSFLTCQC